MTLETFVQLLADLGQSALHEADDPLLTDVKYPAFMDRLTKKYPRDLARAALDTILLRRKAVVKFSNAGKMYFTREALEMASSEAVSDYRSLRFQGFSNVADLTCGIGGDVFGLVRAGCRVTAYDRDPLLLRMAEANCAALQLPGNRFIQADVLIAPLEPCDAAFIDPGRRPGGRRVLGINETEPPLDALFARLPSDIPVAVKVAPGISRDDLQTVAADAEFIASNGELKECTLWFRGFRSNSTKATVLPGPHTLSGDPEEYVETGPLRQYIYDPNPAVSRSGLIAELARLVNGIRFDPVIAAVTSDVCLTSQFATPYQVETILPHQPKKIAEWLRNHHIGRVTPIRLGLPVDLDGIMKHGKLKGDEHRTLLFTRIDGEPHVVVATS